MNKFLPTGSILLVLAIFTGAAQKPKQIRDVDFKNLIYGWDHPGHAVPLTWQWMKEPPKSKIRLQDGRAAFTESHESAQFEQGSPCINIVGVTYGDLDGNGAQAAAVRLNYRTGGTANWDYLYLYRLDHGRVRLLGRLRSGSRADGGLLRVTVKKNLLVLDFADAERRMGDCCSEGYIRVNFAWRHGHFEETGPRERGDLTVQTLEHKE
jgi:hypothetical protein